MQSEKRFTTEAQRTQRRHNRMTKGRLEMTNGKWRMAHLVSVIRHLSSAIWGFLRELSGEAAYERYLDAARTRPSSSAPFASVLTPAALYRQHLEDKYSHPCRCC